MNIKTHKVPTAVGGYSLIGTYGEFPLNWGNYFWLGSGQRVLNMWMENLEEAEKRFLPDGLVEIRDYGDHCLIVDERIPKDWLYNKLCFTGNHAPSLEEVTDMYNFLGDPTNELEQFTDPKSFHEKRGEQYIEYTDESGNNHAMVKRTITAHPRKLLTGWTVELSLI